MKKLILTATIAFFSLALNAQEKEVGSAYTAIEVNDIATAKAEIAKVSGQIDSNLIAPDIKAKYYYTAGKIALAEGRTIEAAKAFSSLGQIERGITYSVKNKNTKETEYYSQKADAEKAEATGNYSKIKEITLKPELITGVEQQLRSKAENLLNQGTAAVQANRNAEAGDKFLEASYLVEAIGGDANLFKYNAALSYHKGKEYQKAFDIYKELIDAGYTGENTSWVGTNKETGEKQTFASKDDADMQQKLGLVTGVKMEKTPSVEKNLFSYALDALTSLKKYDEVVEQISKKYSTDSDIQALVGNVYHFSGNEDMFLNKLIESTKLDPKNPTNYFNIGVIYMDKGDDAKAKEYYEKAIQADPNYKNAYNNLALLVVKPEKEYVEIINSNLGSSPAEKAKYKEYTAKRKALYVQAIPYLEKAFDLDKTDYTAAKALRQAYSAAEMYDKEDAMRAIEKTLQQ